MERKEKKRNRLTLGLFMVYAAFLTWIILFKMYLPGDTLPHLRNVNLIPLTGALVVNGKADYMEVLQNLIAFVPFGIYMGVMKPKAPFWKKLLPAIYTSFGYEVLQYTLSLGATDITDLLSNTAGAAVGIGLYAMLCRICRTQAHRIVNILAGAGTVCAILFLGILIAANH